MQTTSETGQRPPIVREFHIDAPIDDVWNAITQGEEIQRWFAPSAESRPGPGGVIRLSWNEGFTWDMPIAEWEPPRRLVIDDASEAAPGQAAHRIEYTLESERGGTALRLVHSGFAKGAKWDEEYEGTSTGWSFELKSLKHYLETHRGAMRRLVRASAAISIPRAEAWRLLFGDRGIGLTADPDTIAEGDTFEANTATGERLTGRVVMRSPTCLGVVIDQFNNALLRVIVERWCGEGQHVEAMVWLSAYGVEREVVEDFEKRWTAVLTRLFSA